MDTVAVLARTNRALRIFEDVLAREGVRYHLLGKSGYWASPEVKAVLSYLQCVIWPADYAIAGAIRAPFWPSKFLPKSKLCARLKDLQAPSYWALLTKEPVGLVDPKNLRAVEDFVQFIHSLSRYKNLPAPDAVKTVLGALKVGDLYAGEDEPDNSPLDNLQELVKIASRFETLKEFLDYARKVSAASKGRRGVAVGTIHSAKGLEFHSVYLVACQEGMLPHSKSDDLDGERNLYFVGCSRAERRLTITYSGVPSPFLKGKEQ